MKIELKNTSSETIFTYDKKDNSIKATVVEAIRQGVSLRGVDLREANLIGTNLIGAYLRGANLFRADLSGANLSGVNLIGANLSGADLRHANLNGTDLYNTNLRWVNLNGTIFTHSNPVLLCKWSISIMSDGMISIGCETKSIAEWDLWFTGNDVYTTPRDTDEFKLIYANYINIRDYILLRKPYLCN